MTTEAERRNEEWIVAGMQVAERDETGVATVVHAFGLDYDDVMAELEKAEQETL